jgi:hypothetical protein
MSEQATNSNAKAFRPQDESFDAGFSASAAPLAYAPGAYSAFSFEAAQNALAWTYDAVSAAAVAPLHVVGGVAPVLATASAQATNTVRASATSVDLYAAIGDAGVHADLARVTQNASLSYAGFVTVLKDVALGGVTTSEFNALKTLETLFNKSGGVGVSAYLANIYSALVDGNRANALWTGGASRSVALGNLTAGTSQTAMNELIGKWFLGTDLPTAGSTAYPATYKVDAAALFGASGSPSYLDVNQGALGDCYLLASLAEIALKDPNTIKSMFVDDGNGVYGVRFFDRITGKAEYVTVDSELPYFSGNYGWANGSKLEYANGPVKWAALAEKAYAELNAEGVLPRASADSYAALAGGWGDPITEITGKAVNAFQPGDANIFKGWNAGEEILVATGSNATGHFVPSHMFEVVGYNAGNGALELHNPWNTAVSSSNPTLDFWATASDLSANRCTVLVASGAARA